MKKSQMEKTDLLQKELDRQVAEMDFAHLESVRQQTLDYIEANQERIDAEILKVIAEEEQAAQDTLSVKKMSEIVGKEILAKLEAYVRIPLETALLKFEEFFQGGLEGARQSTSDSSRGGAKEAESTGWKVGAPWQVEGKWRVSVRWFGRGRPDSFPSVKIILDDVHLDDVRNLPVDEFNCEITCEFEGSEPKSVVQDAVETEDGDIVVLLWSQ